ncbi:MAG: DNA polymerase III subunit alpha [Akkermansia sp.]|nr:DNA polymerase III subunit alpha [Akkermansiaceae bacterium]MBQ3143418.1 DNA polymerase III subunit alpha [Akkermansia sp.]
MAFTHLHVHTEYSLLDGMIHTKDLIKKCVELGMNSVAVTDHGNVFAAIEFMVNVKKHNKGVLAWNKEHPEEPKPVFKPILGCEVYVAPTPLDVKKQIPGRNKYCHLVLLCENNIGWENLIKIVSRGHLDGFYYKPRIDYDTLREFSEGLICLTGCVSGPMQEWILKDEPEKAEEELLKLVDIYGKNNLFVELQDHELEDERRCTPELVRLARKHDIPLVVTNDAHFLNESDHDAHDIFICVGTGNKRMDGKRMRYPRSVYFKSEEEMRQLFPEYPDAYENTNIIAERCNTSIKLDSTSTERYPEFAPEDGSTREEYLRKVCYEGLAERYGKERAENDQELRARLDYELSIINQLRFPSYFLITADFINWAKDHDIPVGPGRGSAAGSLVAYCMKITNIDPYAFNLIFERFLNPERVSPPDIDIDFCQSRRPEVIEYVRQKYGERAVTHIITYGTMGAKSVIKDVARVLDLSYADSDKIAKLIESGPGVTLEKSYAANEDLRTLVEQDDTYNEVWKYALKLEGTIRNVGMHAAGVVIGDRPLDEYVALTRDDLSNPHGEVVAQCDMGAIYNAGLLKMDFLGLKTLTVMKDAENYVRDRVPGFRYDAVDICDAETYALLNRGDTMGVFQLESGGMVDTCRRYGIDNIEDIIALLALYRPGAMQFMDDMIAVKKGLKQAEYEHPLLETVSGLTYGVMIYQEQVQAAAKLLAGYTLGGADLLRRAMGHKDMQEMAEQRRRFVKGCWDVNQIDEATANAIFDKIQKFAGYGFNKSHSACYGHISYWTAYLKAHYPVEFLCGLMSNESTNEKIGVFIQEANRMGIEVLGPCVNHSAVKFRPETMPNGHLAVRFGLASVKSMSSETVKVIVEEREKNGPYKSLEDFCYRIPPQNVRRNQIEVLVQCGAFDWMHVCRAQIFDSIEQCLNGAATVHKDNEVGQMALFDMTSAAVVPEQQAILQEWPKDKRLDEEKFLTGAYFTGNPLDSMRGIIDTPKFLPIGTLPDLAGEEIRGSKDMAGMLRAVSIKVSKNSGQKFAIITVEDFTGSTEALLWGDSYNKAAEQEGLLEVGSFVQFRARISEDEKTGGKKVSANNLELIGGGNGAPKRRGSKTPQFYSITLNTARHDAGDIALIKDILRKYPGKVPVHMTFRNSLGNRLTMELGSRYCVAPCPKLNEELSLYS